MYILSYDSFLVESFNGLYDANVNRALLEAPMITELPVNSPEIFVTLNVFEVLTNVKFDEPFAAPASLNIT